MGMDEGIVHITSRAATKYHAHCACEAAQGHVRLVNAMQGFNLGRDVAGRMRSRVAMGARNFD